MSVTDHSHSPTLPQTRWSVVARAAQTDTGIRLKALNELLEIYLGRGAHRRAWGRPGAGGTRARSRLDTAA